MAACGRPLSYEKWGKRASTAPGREASQQKAEEKGRQPMPGPIPCPTTALTLLKTIFKDHILQVKFRAE